jgi:hypothetical protein
MKRTLAVLLVAGAATVGVVSAHGALRHPQSANANRTSASAVRHTARTKLTSTFAPGVVELAQNEGLSLSSLTTAATAGQASVVAGQQGNSTCIYLTGGTHAVGGCAQLSGKALAPRIGIVDGGTYAWGLADSRVSGVTVSVNGRSYPAVVRNGVFIAAIPDGSHGSGPIEITADFNNSTQTFSFPGIPVPAA